MNRSVWAKNADINVKDLKVRHGQNNYYAFETQQEKGLDGKAKTIHRDVGIVIPGGIIPLMDFSRAISAPLKEYGFSQACLELVPLKWKNNLGSDWFNVFMTIILGKAVNSILADFPYEPYRHRNLGSHRSSMEAHMGCRLAELYETFGGIMIATQNGECVYKSQLTPAQIEAAKKLGITLGGYVV